MEEGLTVRMRSPDRLLELVTVGARARPHGRPCMRPWVDERSVPTDRNDGFRHRAVEPRRPPAEMIDDEESIDLAVVAEIVNSGVLTAEITAANNHDPDLEV